MVVSVAGEIKGLDPAGEPCQVLQAGVWGPKFEIKNYIIVLREIVSNGETDR